MSGEFSHGGGSSGGGGAPTGAAGGDLSGTYPNPTVQQVQAGVITNGMLAGSINPAKVTGTAVTAADTGTVTSTMIADGTILNADINASAAVAYSKLSLAASVKNSDLVAGSVQEANLNAAYVRNGSTIYRESMPWYVPQSSAVALSTGIMAVVGIPLAAGDVITNVTFMSGGTALATATHWWFALYGADGNLVGQTADQTSTAWGSNVTKTLALASGPFTISGASVGWGYAGVMVAATTPPSLRGSLIGVQIATGVGNQKIAAGTNGSSLTTTAPGGPIAVTANTNAAYAILT